MEFDSGGGSASGMGGLGSEIMKLGIRDKKHMSLAGQIIDIQAERNRQDELRDSGKFNHTCADSGVGAELEDDVLVDMMANLAILVEEVGESATEMNELAQFDHWLARNYDSNSNTFAAPLKNKWEQIEADNHEEQAADASEFIDRVRKAYIARMRTELVQVAAVTLGMIERLDLEG